MDCQFAGRCLRYPQSCYRCVDKELLKVLEDKIRKQRQRKAKSYKISINAKQAPSWKTLEEETAAIISAVPSSVEMEARINPGSGSVPGRPGDNLDDVLFIEDKERQGNILKGGKKSITIEKGWLDKAISEAQGTGKYPVIPFRYKDNSEIYCFSSFQIIVEMTHEIKYLRGELYKAREILNVAKRELHSLKINQEGELSGCKFAKGTAKL